MDGEQFVRMQRQAVLTAVGEIAERHEPVPEPASDEVRVRVRAVGICGSDVHYYTHGRVADFVVESPLVLGHEASGVIDSVGSNVPADRVGERVALEPQATCGVCDQCTAGRYNLCPSVRFFATPPVDGAFAQYVTLPAHRAHPVPDSLSDDAAALVEPLAVAVWATKKAGIGPGDRVLVSGAGPVGLLCADVARAMGAASVTVSDVNAKRLRVARERGADEVCDATTASVASLGAKDVIVEASGAPAAIAAAFKVAAPAARIVLVGLGPSEVALPIGLIQTRELRLTGTFRYASAYPAAIALAASGRVDLDSLVTQRFPLSQTALALQAAQDPHRSVKVIVVPDDIEDVQLIR